MYVHENVPLAFLAHPRTASRATVEVIREIGWKMVGSHHSGPEGPNQLHYFTTVRNHWDALASWWFRMQRQSPEAKMELPWLRNWVRQHPNYCRVGQPGKVNRLWWWLDSPGVGKLTIMRYETLQDDLDLTLAAAGLAGWSPLPLVGNDSGRNGMHYHRAMPPDFAEWIYETFRDEIEELGYRY